MVMSDRIALLRMGELEQIASPREIYNRPATAYTAQFIGHTNLLSGEVKDGIARCQSLSWRTGLRDGRGLFSLRPENIRLAEGASIGSAVRFRAKILRQAFHGATELLQVECAGGLVLSVRTASQENWSGDVDFEFSLRMQSLSEPRKEEPDVLPSLSSRDHRTAASLGDCVSTRTLRSSFLLQLLVGLVVANHRSFLDLGQLPPAAAGECLLANSAALDVDRRPRDNLLPAARLSPGVLPIVLREEKRSVVPVGDHPAVGQLSGSCLRVENDPGK